MSRKADLGGADSRPRIYLSQGLDGSWGYGRSDGPAQFYGAKSVGQALDAAMTILGHPAAVVVIVGPVPRYSGEMG